MRVAIIGAGVAGLGAALALAKDGHDVVVLERDTTPLPQTPDEAFAWQRRGAPQVRHSHAFLARLRNLLRDRLPDVRERLLDAGATELHWREFLPETIDDAAPKPGDEDLVMLCCRRTTFEWVLRSAALGTDRVELRDGAAVTGFLSANGGGPARVTGVRTGDGDIAADCVLDATGRPSKMPEMLSDLGVAVDEKKSTSGIVYLSRFYRIREGATEPDAQPLNGGDLVYVKYAVFKGDNGTFSVTLAYSTDDEDMRSLREKGRFDAATHAIPAIKQWMDPDVSEPISGVHYMGNLINRVRRVVVDAQPRVLGLHPIGDASVCTNPLYGRGCALGLVHGVLFADSVHDVGTEDPHAIAIEFHEATQRELVPWYLAAVDADDASMKLARGKELDGPHAWARMIFAEGLVPAVRVDNVVSRAWMRTLNLLTKPDALLTDGDLIERVLKFYNEKDSRPPEEPLGPPREDFLQLIGGN